MGLFKAVFKTSCEKVNQSITKKEMRSAQKNAYSKTCKQANGKYDPNWHDNYNKNLKREQQKVQDNKDLRSTFFSNL